jgi:hypothetical protein
MPANPEGFWEHHRIMRLNEEILRMLGGSWREPPEMPPGWTTAEELGDTRPRALELIEKSFRGQRLWGWKDPRNSLTLPFWQELLPRMRYVICLRNPLDVAASLERRDDIAPEQACELWLRYVASAILNTAGRPRLFVSYEEYFDRWSGPVSRLADFIGGNPAVTFVDSRQEIEEAINDRLWHHRTSLDEVMRDDRLSSDVLALHLMTEQLRTLTSIPSAPNDDVKDLEDALNLFAKRLVVGTEQQPQGSAKK